MDKSCFSRTSQSYNKNCIPSFILGIRLRRDSWVSVMYAEGLNSAKSSVILQRTDRHEILGQKPAHLQVSL